MADLIQLRRDTKANWATANPVLAIGEPGCETDTRRWKIGDGSTAWNSLDYFCADPIVLFSELDNFKDSNLRDNSTPSRYVVVDSVANKRKVGTLDVISDGMNHVVTQIFTTHENYDDATGTIEVGHHDDIVVCIYRSVKISGGTLPDTNWTRWNYINDEILKGIEGGLEHMSFKDGVFNVSLYNADGDTLATYETLALALAAVPSDYQVGGMSIKFILRTNTGTEEEPVYKDEYVQYRLMTAAWSNNASDWQGVDDVPTAGSENLVKSWGAYDMIKGLYTNTYFDYPKAIKINAAIYVNSQGIIAKGTVNRGVYYFPVNKGDKIIFATKNSDDSVLRAAAIAVTSDAVPVVGSPVLEYKYWSDTNYVDIIYEVQNTGTLYYYIYLPDNQETEVLLINSSTKQVIDNLRTASGYMYFTFGSKISFENIEGGVRITLPNVAKCYIRRTEGNVVLEHIIKENEKIDFDITYDYRLVYDIGSDTITKVTRTSAGNYITLFVAANSEGSAYSGLISPFYERFVHEGFASSISSNTNDISELQNKIDTIIEDLYTESLPINTLVESGAWISDTGSGTMLSGHDNDGLYWINVVPDVEYTITIKNKNKSTIRYGLWYSKSYNDTVSDIKGSRLVSDLVDLPKSTTHIINIPSSFTTINHDNLETRKTCVFAFCTNNECDVTCIRNIHRIDSLENGRRSLCFIGLANKAVEKKIYLPAGKECDVYVRNKNFKRNQVTLTATTSNYILSVDSYNVENVVTSLLKVDSDYRVSSNVNRVVIDSRYRISVPIDSVYCIVGIRANYMEEVYLDFDNTSILDAESIIGKTIFELNPDTDMLQKMIIANKKHYTSTESANTIVPLVMAHVSDIHGAATQYKRFLDFAMHWREKGYIDEIIDTGDICESDYGSSITSIEGITGFDDVLKVIGNHDTLATDAEKTAEGWTSNTREAWQYHSAISINTEKKTDAYNRFIAPYIDGWNVTGQPSNAALNGLCYYYKDYPEKKLRMIAVDVMGYNTDEDIWLQNVMAETLDSNNSAYGYHVFIITHFVGKVVARYDCNYCTLIMPGSDVSDFNLNVTLAESVDAFQTQGGIFAGYISGHFHRDIVGYISDYPKQLVIGVSSGGKTRIRDFSKVAGCKSYDDFQIVSINTYDKTVKLIKVGADTDYYLRKKGTLCVGYALVKDDGTEPGAGETATKVKGIIGEGW